MCKKVNSKCSCIQDILAFYFRMHSYHFIIFAETRTLAHIADGPEVKEIVSDRVEICFYQDSDLVQHDLAGYYAYRVQYIGDIEPGGEAEKRGAMKGDYILEVRFWK